MLKDKLLQAKKKQRLADEDIDNLRAPVFLSMSLRGTEETSRAERDNKCAIGGMRNPRISNRQVPNSNAVGSAVAKTIDGYLDANPAVELNILKSIGAHKDSVTPPTQEQIAACRVLVERTLGTSPPKDHRRLTELQAHIFMKWVENAGDPDHEVPQWLMTGGPAGIAQEPGSLLIFPPVTPEEEARYPKVELNLYHESHMNYTSMDESPHGEGVMEELVAACYVRKCLNKSELDTLLNHETLVLCKLALITTEKNGQLKHRLILDCLKSGSNSQTRRRERILLPSAWDAIRDTLRFLSIAERNEIIRYLVLDFRDAFYKMPLHHTEYKYFVAEFAGSFYVWTRTAQGSVNGPTIFGRLAALTNRMTQSLEHEDRFRIQQFVDDPLGVMRGTLQQTNRIAARVILFWLVLGYDLSWHKGQIGQDVDWIGFHIAHTPQSMTAEIKGDYMEDLLNITERIKAMNIVPRKMLQSYAGKCSHVANLLFAWKPYLEPFWAALYTPKPSRAFKRGIWRVQIEQALFWIHAFLSKSQGTLSRTWLLSAYLNQGTAITMTLDASPWGL